MLKFLNLFKRVSSVKLIEELDGLRFVAISMVFLLHSKSIWLKHSVQTYEFNGIDRFVQTFVSAVSEGVPLFFIISGFILAMPWIKRLNDEREMPNLKTFYLKRLTRLEPPYLISTFLFFLMMPLVKDFDYKSLLPHLLATLTYTHNLIYGYASPLNLGAWSLEIEIQFYLIVPFLIPVLFKIMKKFPVALFLFSFAYPLILFSFIPHSHTGVHRFLHYFLFGFIWAYCFVCTDLLKGKSRWWDVFLLLNFLVYFSIISVEIPNRGYYSLIYLNLIFVGCFKSVYFNRFLRMPFVSIMGGMCYTIYLLHGRFISIPAFFLRDKINTGNFTMDLILILFIVVPVTIICSGVFFYFVEKPCMNHDWPKKLRDRIFGVK